MEIPAMKKRYYNWFMSKLPQRHWNFIHFWDRFLPLQLRLVTEFVFILPLPPKCLNCKLVSPCPAPHRVLYIFLFLLVIWEFCAVCFDHIPPTFCNSSQINSHLGHPLNFVSFKKIISKTFLDCVNIVGCVVLPGVTLVKKTDSASSS